MASAEDFKYLYEELKVFHRNLQKDSSARKSDIKVISRKLRKLNLLKLELENLRDKFNRRESSDTTLINQVKEYVVAIEKYLEVIGKILKDRLDSTGGTLQNINSDSDSDSNIEMGEKFDLKVASSLLPVMNGNENTTKQLIDNIELYNDLLDPAGKKLLTNYVLKTRLTQSAKIKLEKEYASNELLVVALRNLFISKKSAASLSVQLNTCKQNGKSIDAYGKAIEDLMVDLTISQAEGDGGAERILGKVNEKLAINAFANGLNSGELRTIVKARNYSSLSEAIRGAKDEEVSKGNFSNQAHVTHMRGNYNHRGNYRGRTPFGHYQRSGRLATCGNSNSNSFSRNSNSANSGNRQNFNRNFRGNRGNRGFTINQRSNHRVYNMQSHGNNRAENSNFENLADTFFRS